MAGQRIILRGESQRSFAKDLIDKAPKNAVVNIREGKRTTEQNDKMWAMISDVSRAKPDGRMATPETWKALFMHACGHEVQFVLGLNEEPFPVGFRSSRLSVGQMADLITFIYQFGDEHEVRWTEPKSTVQAA